MSLIPGALVASLGRQSLVLQKNAPTILFGTGVVSMIGSTVLACRATLKMDDILEETQTEVKRAKETELKHRETGRYTEEDRIQDTRILYVKAGFVIAKEYAPAVIIGAAGIFMLTKSHNILVERNNALAAAYVALDKGFREYRSRVREKYGEEVDQQLRYNTENVQIEDEQGRKKEVARVSFDDTPSIYARFFDPLNANWSPNPEYSLYFLHCQQMHANNILNGRGHLFLNEVYRMLGMEESKQGQVVGWIRGKHHGEGYVDFGVFHGKTQVARDFVNGAEGSILLDFNVDGPILNALDDRALGDKLTWQS